MTHLIMLVCKDLNGHCSMQRKDILLTWFSLKIETILNGFAYLSKNKILKKYKAFLEKHKYAPDFQFYCVVRTSLCSHSLEKSWQRCVPGCLTCTALYPLVILHNWQKIDVSPAYKWTRSTPVMCSHNKGKPRRNEEGGRRKEGVWEGLGG